jgi:hypothetical protein
MADYYGAGGGGGGGGGGGAAAASSGGGSDEPNYEVRLAHRGARRAESGPAGSLRLSAFQISTACSMFS